MERTLAADTVDPAANRPFPIHGTRTVWLVAAGALDVFLVRLEQGEPVGARRHVVRVGQGGAVFALPPATERGFGLCAVGGPTTRVQPSAPGELPAETLERLHLGWVNALSGAVGSRPSRAGPLDWAALDEFHRSVLDQLVSARERAVEQERRRLKTRAEVDGQLRQAALRQLADSIEADSGTPLVAAASAHPLVLACEAVGQAAGISITVPRSVTADMPKDAIRTVARFSGVRARRIVLKGTWWTEDSGPLLAFLDADNRPVALLPRSGRGYHLYDPAAGTTVHVTRSVAQTLSGIAHAFYRPFPARALNVFDLVAFGLRGSSRDLLAIVGAGLVGGALAAVTPFAMGILFDTVIPGAERGQLVQMVALLLACALASAFFNLVRSVAVMRVEGRMNFSTQAAVWDRLLRLPARFFREYTAGDLAVRSMAVTQIHAVVTGSALASILSAIFSCFSFFLLFYYSPPLALVATALVAVAVAVTFTCSVLNLRHQRTMNEMARRISGLVLELVNGAAKFRVSGAEDRAFAKWAAAFAAQKRTAGSARRISNVLSVFASTFPIVATAALFYGIARLGAGQAVTMTTGEFLAFYAAFGQFLGAVLGISSAAIMVLQAVPLFESAKPILTALPETAGGKGDPGALKGGVELAHVEFRYSKDTPLVLRDLSLSIGPGEFVAIVGPSGSGKSTLLRLLLGFETPESGSVYFDGKNLSGLDLEAVRRQMGVVLQHGKLMIGDIFTNIIGSAPLTLDDAWKAAAMAGLDEDIKAMPMGMHTMIAEGGGGLSGGQRQRLMIARAIVGKPRILLFDEATSALDNRTQAIVSAALEDLEATRIVIAHRLSTVMHADRIFVIEKGVLVQSGTYEELIHQPGAFAELARRQLV
jgi:ATP-binding cassette subfamily C protein